MQSARSARWSRSIMDLARLRALSIEEARDGACAWTRCAFRRIFRDDARESTLLTAAVIAAAGTAGATLCLAWK